MVFEETQVGYFALLYAQGTVGIVTGPSEDWEIGNREQTEQYPINRQGSASANFSGLDFR
jgi:hypothetical protein